MPGDRHSAVDDGPETDINREITEDSDDDRDLQTLGMKNQIVRMKMKMK